MPLHNPLRSDSGFYFAKAVLMAAAISRLNFSMVRLSLFSNAWNGARMGFMGAEVDKGCQQSERADHQRTEGFSAFR
jgi:hypothetical protein